MEIDERAGLELDCWELSEETFEIKKHRLLQYVISHRGQQWWHNKAGNSWLKENLNERKDEKKRQAAAELCQAQTQLR